MTNNVPHNWSHIEDLRVGMCYLCKLPYGCLHRQPTCQVIFHTTVVNNEVDASCKQWSRCACVYTKSVYFNRSYLCLCLPCHFGAPCYLVIGAGSRMFVLNLIMTERDAPNFTSPSLYWMVHVPSSAIVCTVPWWCLV